MKYNPVNPNRDMQYHSLPKHIQENAKRAHEIINMHIIANEWWDIRDKYIALRLSDGGSDGSLYDTHAEAVRHQIHHTQCYYLSFRNLGASGANEREIGIVLNLAEKAYKAGMRFTDPDAHNGGQEMLLDSARIDYERSLLAPKVLLPPEILASLKDQGLLS